MANKRINDLILRSNFDSTCNVPVDDASQSYRVTAAQIRDFVASSVDSITGRTEDLAPNPAADFLQSYDASAAAIKKIKIVRTHDLSVRAETTTYSASIDDDVILCSGSAFTVTLPAAASSSRKVLTIKKTDASLTNVVTIDGNASETIDGNLTTTLNTGYESIRIVCDGSNWHILERKIPSLVASYTPTFTGFGTVSNVNVRSWRHGSFLKIRGVFTSGTSTAVEARMTMGFNGVDGGLSSIAGLPTVQMAGRYNLGANENNQTSVLIEASKAYVCFGLGYASASALTKANGNAVMGGSIVMSFEAEIEISGWND